jgi:hypothetical protein
MAHAARRRRGAVSDQPAATLTAATCAAPARPPRRADGTALLVSMPTGASGRVLPARGRGGRFALRPSTRRARKPPCVSQRLGRPVPTGGGQDHFDGHVDRGLPTGVDGKWSSARPRAQPRADARTVEHKRRPCATRVVRPRRTRPQRPVRNADGRYPEGGPEVQRQPGTAWMIPASGVDQHDVRHARKRPRRRLQQWPLAQRQQPRQIRRTGLARHDRLREHMTTAQHRGRRPCRIPCCPRARPTARKAHHTRADGQHLGRPPGRRIGNGQRTLHFHELAVRSGPHGHESGPPRALAPLPRSSEAIPGQSLPLRAEGTRVVMSDRPPEAPCQSAPWQSLTLRLLPLRLAVSSAESSAARGVLLGEPVMEIVATGGW